jgi:hypothetical protein
MQTPKILETANTRCLIIDVDGPVVADVEGGRRLIEEAMGERAQVIIVPAARLDAAFFQLRSGLAGEILQKAANYGFKFAVIGDISAQVAASEALRDFVVESNRRRSIFFCDDLAALEERLTALQPPSA